MDSNVKSALDFADKLNEEIIGDIISLSKFSKETDHSISAGIGIDEQMGSTLRDAVNFMLAAKNLPEKTLEEYLHSLSKLQIIQLTALVCLGRGDSVQSKTLKENFDDLSDIARENYEDDDFRYLMEKPLAYYLEKATNMSSSADPIASSDCLICDVCQNALDENSAPGLLAFVEPLGTERNFSDLYIAHKKICDKAMQAFLLQKRLTTRWFGLSDITSSGDLVRIMSYLFEYHEYGYEFEPLFYSKFNKFISKITQNLAKKELPSSESPI